MLDRVEVMKQHCLILLFIPNSNDLTIEWCSSLYVTTKRFYKDEELNWTSYEWHGLQDTSCFDIVNCFVV